MKYFFLFLILIPLPVFACIPASQSGIPPSVTINEVNFKSSDQDWVELFIISDGDMSGYTLTDDHPFYTFPEGSLVHSNEYLIIEAPSGLTATTEQIVLRDASGSLIDAICWKNETPTEAELKDLIDFGLDGNGCFSSDLVPTNASLGRMNGDLQIFLHPTKQAKNEILNTLPTAIITIQDGVSSAEAPLSINVDGSGSYDPDMDPLTFFWDFGDGATYLNANPPSHRYEKPGNYTITLTVSDVMNATHQTSLAMHVLENLPATDATPSLPSPDSPQNTSPPPPSESLLPEDLINEFLPNPTGIDADLEWIELYNPSDEEIDLNGFFLDDGEGGSKPYALTEKIPAKSFLQLFAPTTGLTLNNDSDEVRLLDGNQNELQKIPYDAVKENFSFMKTSDGSWQWTSSPTPASENILSEIVTKKKSHKRLVTAVEATPRRVEPKKPKKMKRLKNAKKIFRNGDLSDEILISEIFPNPKGSDRNHEWVELLNTSDDPVNLSNWVLDDSEGGSKPYVIPPFTLQPKQFLLIPSKDSHLALNNTNDAVRLVDFEGTLKDEMLYDDTEEGRSLVRNAGRNIWTDTLTPGKENPSFALVKGTLVAATENVFTIESEDETKHEVHFDARKFPREFRETFPIDREIHVIVEQTKDQTEKLVAVDYIQPPSLKTAVGSLWKTVMNVATGIAVFVGGIFFVSKRFLGA